MNEAERDKLAAIRARTTDCKTYSFGMRSADTLAHEDAPRLLAALEAITEALDDWENATPFPDAERSQQWYSLGKRHAAERIRFEIAEALSGGAL